MRKIDDPKLHRHGDALIRMEQKGGDIRVRVEGERDDLLHMLLAVVKRKNYRLGRLIEQAVLMVIKTETPEPKKQERSVN